MKLLASKRTTRLYLCLNQILQIFKFKLNHLGRSLIHEIKILLRLFLKACRPTMIIIMVDYNQSLSLKNNLDNLKIK